jgi:hypothetical protein
MNPLNSDIFRRHNNQANVFAMNQLNADRGLFVDYYSSTWRARNN